MSINVLNSNGKVTAEHLKKTAYLYIRQSTLRQVFENTESTQRQYALRQRAVVLEVLQICSHAVIGWLDAPSGLFGFGSFQVAPI